MIFIICFPNIDKFEFHYQNESLKKQHYLKTTYIHIRIHTYNLNNYNILTESHYAYWTKIILGTNFPKRS